MIETVGFLTLGTACVVLLVLLFAERAARSKIEASLNRMHEAAREDGSRHQAEMMQLARLLKYRDPREVAVAEAVEAERVFDERHLDDEAELSIHMTKQDEEFLRELGMGADMPPPFREQ